MGYIKNPKGVACPFCNAESVFAKIITTFSFLSEHQIMENGADYSKGDSFREIIGEPIRYYPEMRYMSFRCETCGEMWYSHEYKLVFDKNEECGHFEKVERKQRGRKKKTEKSV